MTGRSLAVLLDYRPAVGGRGGIAVYTRELARAYAAVHPGDRLELWTHRLRPGTASGEPPTPKGARLRRGPIPASAVALLGRFGCGADRLCGGVGVCHWTDYASLPVSRAAVVATVHDVLFDELPSCYTPVMRSRLRAWTRHVVRRAARLIVPSPRSRDALVACYDVEPDRVDAVPLAPRPLPPAGPASEYGRYVLFVGTLEPRKNLARLLLAHQRLQGSGTRLALVVAGPRGWLDEALVDAVRTRPGVAWEGPVGPERLAALYRGALALAHPSLGEGFGLPVVEALALGTPVVVARHTVPADLAGGAGLAVDPRDVDALAHALGRLATDEALRLDLARRGPGQVAHLTWEETARATRRTYTKAGAPSGSSP